MLKYQTKFDFVNDNVVSLIGTFKFIDLFAGIGGFRIAMEKLGGECVFSSEWNKEAQKTYKTNFGDIPYGDITKIDVKDIPSHEILCAGSTGKACMFEDFNFIGIELDKSYCEIANLRIENVKKNEDCKIQQCLF